MYLCKVQIISVLFSLLILLVSYVRTISHPDYEHLPLFSSKAFMVLALILVINFYLILFTV